MNSVANLTVLKPSKTTYLSALDLRIYPVLYTESNQQHARNLFCKLIDR